MPEGKGSPLVRLAVIISCIAGAAMAVSFAYYFFVALPEQQAVVVPENNAKTGCLDQCTQDFSDCYQLCRSDMCVARCEDALSSCRNTCDTTYAPLCSSCKTSCSDGYAACLATPGYTEGDCAGIRDMCYEKCPC